MLPVSAAFHSPLMGAARQRFDQALSQITFAPARIPVYSNVTAEPYSADGSSVRSLLGDQLQHEVRFAEEIERMYRDRARVFVEAGPKGVLTVWSAIFWVNVHTSRLPPNPMQITG